MESVIRREITEIPKEIQLKFDSGEISKSDLDTYRKFLGRVEESFMQHPVVVDNKYCIWFAEGNASLNQVRHFITQFSVFSHLFLIAVLKKMINAGSLETYRATKEILANEIGVIYRRPGQKIGRVSDQELSESEKDLSGDPELVSTVGTVDGGVFRFRAGHFEWLVRMAEHLGLDFTRMGKRKHGTESTLFFCDELARLYGAEDPHIGEGASFAVENWAAAGFWKQLIVGLKGFKENKNMPALPIAFFTWHDKIEDQHAVHVQDELAEVYFQDGFDPERFLQGGIEMLDGVKAFWDGLYNDRERNI